MGPEDQCTCETEEHEMHACPYAVEFGDCDDEHCNCCPDCTQQCAMDI